MTPAAANRSRCKCQGAPHGDAERLGFVAARDPRSRRLFDSTTTGRPRNSGWNTRSHDT